jgi:type IX secretion system PorP/SprF family membrane protein
VALNASYSQKLADEHFLTLGFQVGTSQQRFRPELLTFDEQWNGDILDETIPVTENFNNDAIGLFDISTGLNWHYKGEKITSNIGIGWLHLTKPKFSFFDDDSAILERKISFYIMGTHLLTENIGYSPRIFMEMQNAHSEGVLGLGIIYFLNRNKNNELGIQPSINYRLDNKTTGDAIIPMLEIFYQSWKVGLSYDINTSDFIAATNRRGGFELSIQYIIKKVAPPEVFKACPIF